jgi:Tfp pilus assembly protein PilF
MGKAKAAFEKYLEVSPDEPNAYDSMGEYYMVAKDYAKSAEYYDKAAEMGMELAKERAEKARAAITKN